MANKKYCKSQYMLLIGSRFIYKWIWIWMRSIIFRMLRRMSCDFLGEIAEGRRAPSIDNSKEGFSGERVLVGREEWSFFVNPLFLAKKRRRTFRELRWIFILLGHKLGVAVFRWVPSPKLLANPWLCLLRTCFICCFLFSSEGGIFLIGYCWLFAVIKHRNISRIFSISLWKINHNNAAVISWRVIDKLW